MSLNIQSDHQRVCQGDYPRGSGPLTGYDGVHFTSRPLETLSDGKPQTLGGALLEMLPSMGPEAANRSSSAGPSSGPAQVPEDPALANEGSQELSEDTGGDSLTPCGPRNSLCLTVN
jgi:hypothetical protein